MLGDVSIEGSLQAVERVRERLRKVAAALDAAGVPYCVIGGNAVGAWVQTKDPGAVRSTVDVDLLVNRTDLASVERVMTALGFSRVDMRRLVMFTDPDEPSVRSGVHLIFAGEKVRQSYPAAAPSVSASVRDASGYRVIDLPALLTMKLTSMRPKDVVHIQDMLSVGLIDSAVRSTLAGPLAERLTRIESETEDDFAEDP